MYKKIDKITESIKETEARLESKVESKLTESEARLESKLTLAFVREVQQQVRCEVQHAMGLVNARKNVEA